jgi:hypothetical protein
MTTKRGKDWHKTDLGLVRINVIPGEMWERFQAEVRAANEGEKK